MSYTKRGLFIVFEGIDGSGTSTHVHRLSEKVEILDKYQDILRTHEPWRNKEIKRKLEEDKDAYSDPEKMAQLYVADRVDHSYRLIDTNLNAGAIVICSRYKMSTCAFQQAQGISLDKLLEMHEYRGVLTPDIVFFLDVSREVAEERIKKRGIPQEKFERDRKFIEKVIENYRNLIELSRKNMDIFGRVERINTEKPIEEASKEVYQKFLRVYQEWLKKN